MTSVNFLQIGGQFALPPETAIKQFEAKGLKASFAWQDMVGEEHAKAFTVAKMMDMDLLADVQTMVGVAMADGLSLESFIADLKPKLEEKGWWGKKDVIDPLTGNVVNAQLGSAARLETIYRTNMQSSYSVGAWENIQQNKHVMPWLLYDAVDDGRTRPEHQRMNKTLLPVSDPFWRTHYPPNGWNCRCGVIQLSDNDLSSYGLKQRAAPDSGTVEWTNPRTGVTSTIPADLDPGWDVNMGMLHADSLTTRLAEKTAALDEKKASAVKSMTKKMGDAQKKLAEEIGKAELERIKNKTALKIKDERNKQIIKSILDGKSKDPGRFKQTALKKLKATGQIGADSSEIQIEKVKTLASILKEQHAVNTKLSGYKKKILEGKLPTPSQTEAFNSLDKDAQNLFIAKIDKAKIAKAPVVKETAVNPVEKSEFIDIKMSDLIKVGSQAGSNAGGMYQSVDTGKKYYIKFPDSESAARNEVLAGKLYQQAGVQNVAKTHLFKTTEGNIGVVSEFEEGLVSDELSIINGKIHGVNEGFAADAWLANWDVTGLGFDNLLVKNGSAYRIDAGGALEFRAMGGLKGGAFGNEVTELDTLLNKSINPNSASAFSNLSKDDVVAGIRRINAIDDKTLKSIIDTYHGGNQIEKQQLFDKLIARRNNLNSRYPEARAQVDVVKLRRDRVEVSDIKQIEQSRINGYSIPTDKGDIEDHNVMFTNVFGENGEEFTRVTFKATEDGMKKIKESINQYFKAGDYEVSREQTYYYHLNQFDKSKATMSGVETSAPLSNHHIMTSNDGVTSIVYFDDTACLSLKGMVQVDIKKSNSEGVIDGFGIIEKMGLDTSAPTQKIREELYLDQIAYVRNTGNKEKQQAYKQLTDNFASEDDRIREKANFLSRDIGVDDVTKLQEYNPDGRRQAFDHGRVKTYRPDLDDIEFNKFKAGNSLYHNPLGLSVFGSGINDDEMLTSIKNILNGGGQLTSQVDRLRRGLKINDTSPESDFRSGGASYVFTRIVNKNNIEAYPGFYWSVDEVKRLDAISYNTDLFGASSKDEIEQNRKTDIKDYEKNAKNNNNEFIFKDGLSFFDNLNVIVFRKKGGANNAIKELKALGYSKWSDGRKVEDVIRYVGQKVK